MLFKKAYKYLATLKGSILTIKELNDTISQTEQFQDPVDGYLLTDCIVDNKYCSFNSFADDKGNVILIDISFNDVKDFETIKEMSWDNIDECDNFIVQVTDVTLYN
ncbi:hypothetical protein EXM65_12900 [Clostridium botulinum]|uniref:Uncharacterized protein n=1 Tax=Clostridium botulinum TaxID=1491 RepID=A0A6M0SR19_CLOBO|nr:hypothetical protein [Clostridium botulinum]